MQPIHLNQIIRTLCDMLDEKVQAGKLDGNLVQLLRDYPQASSRATRLLEPTRVQI